MTTLLSLLVGCTPHSADVTTGSTFTALLSHSTSTTLDENLPDWVTRAATTDYAAFDCRNPDDYDEEDLISEDVFEDVYEKCECDDSTDPECDDWLDPEHERWLVYDGYHVVKAELAPWRGEAIITSEGDLQLTFHNELPDGEDFRFAFVIDPHFQPSYCGLDENGESVRIAKDGDWLAQWSAGKTAPTEIVDGDETIPVPQENQDHLNSVYGPVEGTMFYLNAGAYQFNPSSVDTYWILPQEWLAGFALAKFAQEDVYMRSPRYGMPDAYAQYELAGDTLSARDLFYCNMDEGADPTDPANCYQTQIDRVCGDPLADITTDREDAWGVVGQVKHEWGVVGVDIAPRCEVNEWRIPDGEQAGLDGWVGLHYNWVRFDQQPEDLAVGNPASGEFHLVMDAIDSQSRVVLRGGFEVEEIERDKWTVENLSEEKLAEYGTTLCGEEEATDAE